MDNHDSTILLAEDDKRTAHSVAGSLVRQGFTVYEANDGQTATSLLRTHRPALLVLDLMLPKLDGFGVLSTRQTASPETKVLILSARDSVADRVRGLDLGADDYLAKPFSLAELSARVRAILRRGPQAIGMSPQLTVSNLTIDRVRRVAFRGGRQLRLTPREFDLLVYLAQHANQTVARHAIACDVWHVSARATPIDNVIEVHVARIRRELDKPNENALLRTVRGVGYLLTAEGI
jgi:two-component system, OmpR family, copper resistance phosphate regulon response regulator CusR